MRVNGQLRDHLDAFAALAADLSRRPTHLAEIVPEEPAVVGTVDAAKAGMGGVFFDAAGDAYVWRQPFSPEVQARMNRPEAHPYAVTNSDLEQAGIAAHLEVITEPGHLAYATVHTFCDNTPAVSRFDKGAVSVGGPAAYLCRGASEHQRRFRYCSVVSYLPGEANVMADDASRLQHLTDVAFLAHFEQHYPQPRPWRLRRLTPQTNSRIHSRLL